MSYDCFKRCSTVSSNEEAGIPSADAIRNTTPNEGDLIPRSNWLTYDQWISARKLSSCCDTP